MLFSDVPMLRHAIARSSLFGLSDYGFIKELLLAPLIAETERFFADVSELFRFA